MTRLHVFSCASHLIHAFASYFDWLSGLALPSKFLEQGFTTFRYLKRVPKDAQRSCWKMRIREGGHPFLLGVAVGLSP